MSARISPQQMVANTLRDGPRWIRSLQVVKRTLDQMIEDGEVHRIKPEGGRARNMVELTGRGWAIYFGENMIVSRLDRLAELMAEGFDPYDAGRELFLRREEVTRFVADMKRHLGEQAA